MGKFYIKSQITIFSFSGSLGKSPCPLLVPPGTGIFLNAPKGITWMFLVYVISIHVLRVWRGQGRGQGTGIFAGFTPKTWFLKKIDFGFLPKTLLYKLSINANPEGEFTEMSYRNEKYPNCVPVDLYSNTSPPQHGFSWMCNYMNEKTVKSPTVSALHSGGLVYITTPSVFDFSCFLKFSFSIFAYFVSYLYRPILGCGGKWSE